MRRPHRRWHRLAWLILPAVVAVLLVAALDVRPPLDANGAIAIGGEAR